MSQHDCKQVDKLSKLMTDIELLKLESLHKDAKIQELQSNYNFHNKIIITSLISMVVGVVVVLIEKY